jgi:hypothetical protein
MVNKVGRNDPCPCGSGKKYKNCCKRKEQGNVAPAMPGRPRQHEIDEEALIHIRNMFPNGWTLEEVKRDYGKDLRAEIFANGKATGLEFVIQSKGHERFTVVHMDKIAQTLKIATLNYFEQTLLPILLVVYSVEKKLACYLWIKPYIRDVIDPNEPNWRTRDGDSEITIHIPISNVLSRYNSDAIWSYVEVETSRLLNVASGISPLSVERQELLSSRQRNSISLLRPKITNYLHRSRLTDRISKIVSERGLFLHTDAGYGKTWLIHDFTETSKPAYTIWYTFDSSTTSALQFVQTIASELSRQAGNSGIQTLSYLRDRGNEAKVDEALAIFLAEMSTVEGSWSIVIEDLHHVADHAIVTVLESLVKERPINLHLLLTSRHPLPFNQAKLIGQGLLAVIEQSEIAFRVDELEEYLQDNFNIKLSSLQSNYLQQRTDGWIAAIALAASIFQRISLDNIEALFDRLTGFSGNLYDFFAQEVYASLNSETQKLLKRLGVARIVEPDIVDLFTGNSDGGQILRDLAKHNTFLVEDTSGKSYRFHLLFAEFLETRLGDEEGSKTLRDVHGLLAHHYAGMHDWFKATDHAIDAEEYDLAVEGLERVVPVGLNLGYGSAVLDMIARIPSEHLNGSGTLLESKGRAALQLGDVHAASEALKYAQAFYNNRQDDVSLNRLEYLLAEVRLATGEIGRDEFVRTANRTSQASYAKNDIQLGAQAELRMIEVGQTLTAESPDLLADLLKRISELIERLEQSDEQLTFLRARAFAAQAHLMFQVVSGAYGSSVAIVRIRSSTGHPISKDERILLARTVFEGYQHILDLYEKAENLAKEHGEIEGATIRMQRVADQGHHLALSTLVIEGTPKTPEMEAAQEEKERILNGLLYALNECANVFAKYHMLSMLAVMYCNAADIYDILRDFSNRDRAAQQALDLATSKGWSSIAERATKILRNESTFSSFAQQVDHLELNKDKDLAAYDEEDKKRYVAAFLQAYAGDIDAEKMRESVMSDMNDMVAAARQRLEWCQHIQIIQELEHTRSLATMHRTIPKKHIVCALLRYESPKHGHSFDELWPFFKGIYCLGCTRRSLAP